MHGFHADATDDAALNKRVGGANADNRPVSCCIVPASLGLSVGAESPFKRRGDGGQAVKREDD